MEFNLVITAKEENGGINRDSIDVTMSGDLNPGIIEVLKNTIKHLETQYGDTMKLSAALDNIPIKVEFDGKVLFDEDE